jgi:hypothetical protein
LSDFCRYLFRSLRSKEAQFQVRFLFIWLLPCIYHLLLGSRVSTNPGQLLVQFYFSIFRARRCAHSSPHFRSVFIPIHLLEVLSGTYLFFEGEIAVFKINDSFISNLLYSVLGINLSVCHSSLYIASVVLHYRGPCRSTIEDYLLETNCPVKPFLSS